MILLKSIRFFFLVFVFFPLICFSQYNIEHSVYFETDKFVLPKTEEIRLYKFIGSLSKESLLEIEISGFCDDVGAETYNLVLSENRAKAIESVFSILSFFPEKIVSVDGKGEVLLNLFPSENTEIMRSLNRRVDVVVSYKDTSTPAAIVEAPQNAVVLENVHFITGYSYLTRDSKTVLNNLAETLKKETYSFLIQGHVCCTEGQNDAIDRKTDIKNLSVARAKYVYDFLLEKGVDKKRMSYEGLARKFPLGGSSDKDRRVEIVISSD